VDEDFADLVGLFGMLTIFGIVAFEKKGVVAALDDLNLQTPWQLNW